MHRFVEEKKDKLLSLSMTRWGEKSPYLILFNYYFYS